ncbi:MAG: CPBP family intramembrane metalloprotease [Thermoproteota archaeon]|nr:MAG: CPBP family intramembrane metalloprotease [Candidatus Korarchaeota archaeon]
MNKGIKGVVAGIGIMLTFDVLTLMLRREIGFVPIGLITFILIYLIVRLIGYTREDVGLAGPFDWKLHVALPMAFVFLNFTWILPFGVGIRRLHVLLYIAELIKYLVFVALYEELLFRGIIQRGFELWKGPKVAIILTAIIFGLSHMASRFTFELSFTNFWRIYNPLLFGFAWGVYRWKFRHIGGLILAHGLGDFIDRILTLERSEWLLNTTAGHIYMIVAYTIVQLVTIYAYLKLGKRYSLTEDSNALV